MSGYSRILLKISGESLGGEDGRGIDHAAAVSVAERAIEIAKSGRELAIVVGGGNFIRGALSAAGVDRVVADRMGMLATVINGMALADAIEAAGHPARVMSAIRMEDVAEPFVREVCLEHLHAGRIVILAGGTGNPFFTTDTAAALRAGEIAADVVLKATKVDGVFSSDPMLEAGTVRYERLKYIEVISRQLKVMDAAAISLCMENHIPIVVFNMSNAENFMRAASGEPVGTYVGE